MVRVLAPIRASVLGLGGGGGQESLWENPPPTSRLASRAGPVILHKRFFQRHPRPLPGKISQKDDGGQGWKIGRPGLSYPGRENKS